MKRALKIALLPALVLGLILGVRLFHVGPFGIHPGDNVMLARFALTDGTSLCVIAHRTDSWGEPFEVTLYRTDPDGEVFTYYMGYEDSFWWACTIRVSGDPQILKIRADGSIAAVYHVNDHSLTFPHDYYHYGVQTGRRAGSDAVPRTIRSMER